MLAAMAAEHIVIVVTHDPELLLAHSSSLLYLDSGNGKWFAPNDFLRHALGDSDFFPLPDWYRHAVIPYLSIAELPQIEASAVYRFIKERGTC